MQKNSQNIHVFSSITTTTTHVIFFYFAKDPDSDLLLMMINWDYDYLRMSESNKHANSIVYKKIVIIISYRLTQKKKKK